MLVISAGLRAQTPLQPSGGGEAGAISWQSYTLPVPAAPLANQGWQRTRRTFLAALPDGRIAGIWQSEAQSRLFLTLVTPGQLSSQTRPLPNPIGGKLLAACSDSAGMLYYALATPGPDTVSLMLCKASAERGLLLQEQYETGSEAFDVWQIDDSYPRVMRCQGQTLLLMLTQEYHAGSDGLNHQGGTAWLFDAATLRMTHAYGQTSGHSFDNWLMPVGPAGYLGVDLGDNYPRGVHLHRFSIRQPRVRSQVVYTFKTEHGTRPSYAAGLPDYPVYPEISNAGRTYYRWSNDNATYGRIGGLAEVSDGYLVFFTGEPGPDGNSLDNSRAGRQAADPRNVGFVKVRKDFFNYEDLADMILSPGAAETGGYYSFGGDWMPQANHGVNWLTEYSDPGTPSAHRLQVAQLSRGRILLLWMLAASEYGRGEVRALVVDGNGTALGPELQLGTQIGMELRDDPLVLGGEAWLAEPDPRGKALILHRIRLR
ncbi:MAG: hypothetical protein NW241_02315 [Bacteroidia bacterium]|nr:hypothetical protein [Bacteroidia bacterium]